MHNTVHNLCSNTSSAPSPLSPYPPLWENRRKLQNKSPQKAKFKQFSPEMKAKKQQKLNKLCLIKRNGSEKVLCDILREIKTQNFSLYMAEEREKFEAEQKSIADRQKAK
jgi:hypothetical protein